MPHQFFRYSGMGWYIYVGFEESMYESSLPYFLNRKEYIFPTKNFSDLCKEPTNDVIRILRDYI